MQSATSRTPSVEAATEPIVPEIEPLEEVNFLVHSKITSKTFDIDVLMLLQHQTK